MPKVGIIGAMDLEIKLLLDSMDIYKKEIVAGFSYYIGKIFEKNVIVTCCGIGKVNAAACTQILIDKFGVDSIINTGIAGGLHRDVKVCDIVISSDVTHHDVRKNQMKKYFPFKENFDSHKELIEAAVKACENNNIGKNNFHIGRIVSGECFVNDNILKKNIMEEYSPHCIEMEGSAIGHVSHINNIPFVVIRSISDNADEEAKISYEKFEEIAANQSSSIVLNMLEII